MRRRACSESIEAQKRADARPFSVSSSFTSAGLVVLAILAVLTLLSALLVLLVRLALLLLLLLLVLPLLAAAALVFLVAHDALLSALSSDKEQTARRQGLFLLRRSGTAASRRSGLDERLFEYEVAGG
jgi:hypothetical protein